MTKLRKHPPDCIVSVGTGDKREEFEVYEVILCMASEVFDAMLGGSMRESHTSRIDLPDKDAKEWTMFYKFIDPKTCRESKITTENVFKLVPWFHHFQMDSLLQECDQVMNSYLISKQPTNWQKLTESQFEKLIKWAGFSNLYGLKESLFVSSNQIKMALSVPLECVGLQSIKSILPLIRDSDILWKVIKEYLPTELQQQQQASDAPPSGNSDSNSSSNNSPLYCDREALAENQLTPYLVYTAIQRKRDVDDSKRTSFERYIYDELQKKGHTSSTIDQCLKEVRFTITRYKSLQVTNY